eukprot:2725028-Pyramimonas_sp.AAC.1
MPVSSPSASGRARRTNQRCALRSTPGAHPDHTRSTPGAHPEHTRSTPGSHPDHGHTRVSTPTSARAGRELEGQRRSFAVCRATLVTEGTIILTYIVHPTV